MAGADGPAPGVAKVTNPDRVLYPAIGFTKAQVIEYYAAIAPTMLPHLRRRPVTMHRFPEGVDKAGFFQKNCPGHRPDWVGTIPEDTSRGIVEFCEFDRVEHLRWSANLAAIELHTPMAAAPELDQPTMLVFDLDPGAPAALAECAQVAEWIRYSLDLLDLRAWPKTSGSKGLQVYVPLNTPTDFATTSQFAHAFSRVIERAHPDLVLTVQDRAARKARVLIDWSQNSHHKTTVCVYSMRARERPTVSTPVTWDEVAAAADGAPLAFEPAEVLERVERHGDLFADTLTLRQRLPKSA